MCASAGCIDTNNPNKQEHVSFTIQPDTADLAAADLRVKFAVCALGLIIGGEDATQETGRKPWVFGSKTRWGGAASQVVREVPVMDCVYLVTAFKVKIGSVLDPVQSRPKCSVHSGGAREQR